MPDNGRNLLVVSGGSRRARPYPTEATQHMNQTIRYSVVVDGARTEASYTTDEVGDDRAAWNERVAVAYARWHAGEQFGRSVEGWDPATIEIEQLGDTGYGHDETGGVRGGL